MKWNAPLPKQTKPTPVSHIIIAIVAVIAMFYGFRWVESKLTEPEKSVSAPANQAPATPIAQPSAAEVAEKQRQRKALIAKLIQSEILVKTDERGAWTGAAWSGLTFDQKKSFVGVLYAYACPEYPKTQCGTLVLRNGFTGKRVGIFSPAVGGLHLD